MLKWVLIVCTVCASSAGDILCAKGMSEGRELNDFHPTGILHALEYILTRRLVILGYVCYALAFVSLMGLLSVAQLTVAIPATAFSFVVDTIGARFILHEHIPWKRWIGVACVSAGVVLVVRPGPSAPTPLARPTGPGCVAMQPCQNQPSNHHPRSERLHK
ncbi:MAG TPA: DMT family transporter [Terracidiphilus sp.]|nr:DMT family transporter [Terracidiphilus sp.]